MKKWIVPAVLLVLIAALFVFLKADPFKPSLDGARYMSLREEIDDADMDVFAAGDNEDLKNAAVKHRDSLWGVLVAMRNLDSPEKSEPAQPAAVSKPEPQSSSGSSGLVYVIGGLIVLIVILGGVLLFLRNRQEAITQQLEKIREDNRFKTPKSGFPDDPTYVGRTRVHRSIIDDVKGQENTAATVPGKLPKTEQTQMDFEFENAQGEVERPVLRPTAKERITSAMQALSDTLAGLRTPKGVHRDPDKVNKYRAQSHNTVQSETVAKPNPLEMTRFDQAKADKERILQLNRRGYTSSEIARRTNLSEEQVETVIRIKRETGE